MKIGRLFWTVINLKPTQIVYQIRYRLWGYKKITPVTYQDVRKEMDISITSLDEDEIYISRFRPEELLDNHIWLLNDIEVWKPGKWNYPDKTHLWNFNLHYFEYGIALAYQFKKRGDIKYYKKLEEMYKDWHKTCFADIRGDAWHPYTISLRLKNLLIIYGMLADKKNDWLNLIRLDVSNQYQFLMYNQEKNLLGNHYFENLTTLYICSKFFMDRKRVVRFNDDLIDQVKEQVLPDGMHFERSFMYHNLVMEDLVRIYKVADELSKQIIRPYIQAMADCLYSFEEEFRLPLFNDAGSNVAKRKSQLLIAAKTVADINAIPQKSLHDGGYFKLESDKTSLIVDAGNYAPRYISGHGHCDMMSFEMFYDNEPVIVNSGTYQYQTKYREKLRSTSSHSTLQIKGVEQSEIWGEHRTGRMAELIKLNTSERSIEADFIDYMRDNLKRRISLDHSVLIEDMSSKPFISYWHIYPENSVWQVSDEEIQIITPKGNRLSMKAEGGEFTDITEKSIYSEEFGKYQKLPSFSTKANIIKIIEN
ncbi:MAG: hypothetical protein E7302_07485 [Butyrivibrio sp.]|nr:hypothetical protein [Butyrivibrio sp.]